MHTWRKKDYFLPGAHVTLIWLLLVYWLVSVLNGCAWEFQELHFGVSWVFLVKAVTKSYSLKQLFYIQHFLLETDHSNKFPKHYLCTKTIQGCHSTRWKEKKSLQMGVTKQASWPFLPKGRKKVEGGQWQRQLHLLTVWRLLKLFYAFLKCCVTKGSSS